MLRKRLGIEAIERDWTHCIGNVGHYFKIPSTLIVPKSVKRIGGWAFWCCGELEEVVMSDGIEEIGDHAFNGCKKLEKVVISESVEYIGISSFCWCNEAVVTLKKPRSEFNFIATNAFNSCKGVKEKVRN